jgi:hypothetical protein
MKRSSRVEGKSRLASSEGLLRKSLLDVLPSAAVNGSLLFTNSRYNSFKLPAHLLDPEAEAFFDLAQTCVELREHLHLPTAESIGQLFIDACEEASGTNEHRRGPRRLAAALLERLSGEG